MSDPFVAEIRAFPYYFAPNGWAFCDGSLLPISQYTALFSLIGNFYGGDGRSTFALPDLRTRLAMGAGQAPGLSNRGLAEVVGSPTVALSTQQLGPHTHSLVAASTPATTRSAQGTQLAIAATDDGQSAVNTFLYVPGGSASVPLNAATVTATGGGAPHSNMMPSLAFNYCIALVGVFPPRP